MHIVTEDSLVPMVETPYQTEDILQKFIADFPDLMPGELIDEGEPRRWILISREAGIAAVGGTSRFWLDHLFLDQDGIPTLVEVKRSSDTRSRREVVAQMLDYAANLSTWSHDQIATLLKRRCKDDDLDFDGELEAFLTPDVDPSGFWERVGTNISAGRLRLIFVGDKISPEVRQIIEFLNGQLRQVELLGVELRQWKGEGVTALVSSVVGQTYAARVAKQLTGMAGPQLTESEYLDALDERCSSPVATGIRALMKWCSDQGGFVTFGRGRSYPACYLNWPTPEGRAVWPLIPTVPSYITVPFDVIKKAPPFDSDEQLTVLVDKLNSIPGIALSLDQTRPSFPFEVVADVQRREQVQDALKWFLNQLSGFDGSGGQAA
jgi:hypothetical protein